MVTPPASRYILFPSHPDCISTRYSAPFLLCAEELKKKESEELEHLRQQSTEQLLRLLTIVSGQIFK